jgi:uncharacterized membrane protein YbhN (UPF0104 family)
LGRTLGKSLGKSLLSLVGILLAAYLLHRIARRVDAADVLAALAAVPVWRLAAVSVVVAVSYLGWSLVDRCGLRHAGQDVPFLATLRTSFVAYVFNFNFGTLIGALAMRVRLYGREGVRASNAIRVTTYAVSASLLGYALVAGVLHLTARLGLTAAPFSLPAAIELKWGGDALRALLAALPLVLGLTGLAYLGLCAWQGASSRTIRIHRWTYELPGRWSALVQCALGSTQWALAAFLVYLLLPAESGIGFPQVLAIQVTAAFVGTMTHVPAGLGVMEATYVAMLAGAVPDAAVVGAILAFRVAYHWLPLVAAGALYVALELKPKPQPHSGDRHVALAV